MHKQAHAYSLLMHAKRGRYTYACTIGYIYAYTRVHAEQTHSHKRTRYFTPPYPPSPFSPKDLSQAKLWVVYQGGREKGREEEDGNRVDGGGEKG